MGRVCSMSEDPHTAMVGKHGGRRRRWGIILKWILNSQNRVSECGLD